MSTAGCDILCTEAETLARRSLHGVHIHARALPRVALFIVDKMNARARPRPPPRPRRAAGEFRCVVGRDNNGRARATVASGRRIVHTALLASIGVHVRVARRGTALRRRWSRELG